MQHASSSLPAELEARLRALKAHHVPDLPWRQVQVLTLHAIGFADPDLAPMLQISVATARGLTYAARRAVVPGWYATPAGESQPLHPDHRNATAWAWVHRSCCTATAFSALQLQEPAAAACLLELSARPFPSLGGELALIASLTACGLADDEVARVMSLSTAGPMAHTASPLSHRRSADRVAPGRSYPARCTLSLSRVRAPRLRPR